MAIIYVNGNPKYIPTTKIVHNKKWREATAKEFYEKYGAWQIFVGVPTRQKKTWIEQYRKKGV